ncbi:MAG: tetratricopeptide repeat protein [Gemmatimonadaceae bacterium]
MLNSALIDDLERQFAENPRRVFARLANEYRKSGELDRAIEICQVHVPQQPGYISGYIVMGQALFESGRLDEAHATFQTALDLDPENLIALRHLGDITVRAGDPSAARLWYQRLLEIDPQNEEIAAQLEQLAGPPAEVQAPSAAAPDEVSWGDIQLDKPGPVESADDAVAVDDALVVDEAPAPPESMRQEERAFREEESALREMIAETSPVAEAPMVVEAPAEPYGEPTETQDVPSYAAEAAFEEPYELPVASAEPAHYGDDFAPGDIVPEADPFGPRADAGRASMADLSLDGEAVLEVDSLGAGTHEAEHVAALEPPPSPATRSGGGGVTIRSFLASLAGRRPPRRPAASEPAPAPAAGRPVPSNGGAGAVTAGGEGLFGGAAVSQADETAATVLAAAFSEDYLDRGSDSRGQPTRAAAKELSLDDVFRDPRAREGDARGGRAVSFDEFFAPRAGEAATDGAEAGDDANAPQPSSDLELFHAWLEGLKK